MMEYKGYLIFADRVTPTCYKVAVKGQGGKIPNVLDSLFTSTGIAKYEIDNYLNNKGVRNGKARSESGS